MIAVTPRQAMDWFQGLADPYACYLLIRHSHKASGPDKLITISEHGRQLCQRVRRDYQELAFQLQDIFGGTTFLHSERPRTLATLWEIFYPDQVHLLPQLTLRVGLSKIDQGHWLEAQLAGGHSLNEIFQTLHGEMALLEDQPYAQAMARMAMFFSLGSRDWPGRLFIGVGHEPEPTLWVLKNELLPLKEVGLAECQAYLVATDQQGGILGVCKFAPEATTK